MRERERAGEFFSTSLRAVRRDEGEGLPMSRRIRTKHGASESVEVSEIAGELVAGNIYRRERFQKNFNCVCLHSYRPEVFISFLLFLFFFFYNGA